MSLHTMLESLQGLPLPTDIREDGWSFPIIECVHVLAITFVVGTVVMVDLRLLGMASRSRAVSRLTSEILPWTWGGFVVALITGSLMFSSVAGALSSTLWLGVIAAGRWIGFSDF